MSEKIRPVPEPEEKSAAAQQEILDQSVRDLLLRVRPEDLIGASPDAEVRKGTAARSCAWVHGPAQLEMLAMADRRLTNVANLKPWGATQVNRVDRVHAKLIKGTKLLVIKAAAPTDLTAFTVNRYANQSGAWVNLFSLLAPAGLTVETGWRERYRVDYIPEDSPLWPGLVMDLGRPTERRQEPRRKKKGTGEK